MIVVVIGPPASGKSYLIAALQSVFSTAEIVQIDSLIDTKVPSKEQFDISQQMFLHRIEQSRSSLVIVENNLPLPSSRRKLVQLAEKLQKNVFFVEFQVPLDVLITRNEKRGTSIDNKVVEKLFQLSQLGGRSRVVDKIVLGESYDIDLVIKEIEFRGSKPFVAKQLQTKTTADDAEQLSRRILGEYATEFREHVQKLNEIRKVVVKKHLNINELEEGLKKQFDNLVDGFE